MSRPERPAAVGALRSLGAGERTAFFRELISIATEQTESTAEAKDLLASLPIDRVRAQREESIQESFRERDAFRIRQLADVLRRVGDRD